MDHNYLRLTQSPRPLTGRSLVRAATYAGAQSIGVASPSPRLLARTNTVVGSCVTGRTSIGGVAHFENKVILPPRAAADLLPKCNRPDSITGVYDFLRERGLEQFHDSVISWCEASGAAFLEEVQANLEEIADALKLTEAEKKSLLATPCNDLSGKSTAARTMYRGITMGPNVSPPSAVSSPLARTSTVPVTAAEVGKAATRAEKAYIPLQAWPVTRVAASTTSLSSNQVASASLSASNQAVSSQSGMAQSGTCTLRERCPGGSARNCDLSPLSRRQVERQSPNFYRMRQWTPPRYRASADTVHVVKMRMANPQHFDLSAAKAAQANLATAVAGSKVVQDDTNEVKEESEMEKPSTFEGVQQEFLRQHAARIKEEIPGVRLVPTQVGHKVSQNFMQSVSHKSAELLPAYHGTNARNFSSIQEKGLLVPGHGGVTVAHGSAHGVGIYTAVLGNSWLSKGFCDSDDMFVCGVVDSKEDDKEERKEIARTAKVAKAASQSGPRFHRTSNKPATAIAVQSKTIGNFAIHRETANVRHVGGAMVVFDETKVAPLFVAKGIGKTSPTPANNVTDLWLRGNSNNRTGACIGGGYWVGADQVRIGEESFWIPPEDWRNDDGRGKELRHRWTAKARDLERRSRRDMKQSGESQRV